VRVGVPAVRRAIRSAGLAGIRAPRIIEILRRIETEQGELSLDLLWRAPVSEARAYLESLPGVGPKTASCVLLFDCGRPVFPVDTHVARITRRLGWVSAKASPEGIQSILEPLIPPRLRYGLHVNMIAHGRQLCRPQRARCDLCPVRPHCPAGQRPR